MDKAQSAPQRHSAASRVEGLGQEAVQTLQRAAFALEAGRLDEAGRSLPEVLERAPDHPEALRLLGILLERQQRGREAVALQRRALAAWPDDALILGNLGSALAGLGEDAAALDTFRRATQVAPNSGAAWFNYGKQLDIGGDTRAAADALARALEVAPDHVPARLLHGEVLGMLGDTDAAAAQLRETIRRRPKLAHAWIDLANLKTVALDEAEEEQLQALLADPELGEDDRSTIGFALGKALEDRAEYADAHATFTAANALKRRVLPWDAAAHRRHVDAIAEVFGAGTARAQEAKLGEEIIFIVGLPRSGSTLIEQILASHPEVAGANELPDLEYVLIEEARRRGQPFPAWAASATPQEWERLGRRYLERTARWRADKPRSTDKRPENWAFVGAALAMLPGARVIDCRRDALETAWSCFKQSFGPQRLPALYDLDGIAQYQADHDRLSASWRRLHPDRFREQSYEALQADPETEIRALLEFCGLPFDPACLDFHQTRRVVRTVSAAQVRQPLRSDTARSAHYGELLDPLRQALRTANEAIDEASESAPSDFAATQPERLAGLSPDAVRALRGAGQHLLRREFDAADAALEHVLAEAPAHPEALRLFAIAAQARGRFAQAIDALRRALAVRPNDAVLINTLAAALADAGHADAALDGFRRACEVDPTLTSAWLNLANALHRQRDHAGAEAAYARAVALQPQQAPIRIAQANVLKELDRPDAAAAAYRAALSIDPTATTAWVGLAELDTTALHDEEVARLQTLLSRADLAEDKRSDGALALARALEDRGHVQQAFDLYVAANTIRRRQANWDAAALSRHVDAIMQAFERPPAAAAADFGSEAIFLVGMPQCGAEELRTLLAQHPEIEDAQEPGDLLAVLQEESARRELAFPLWVGDAGATDWQRLGQQYLERTQRWRLARPRHLDASLSNWPLLGAVRAMLPGARIVNVRRDPLEACWACFKKSFAAVNRHAFSYTLDDLAAYWLNYDRLSFFWHARYPGRIYEFVQEEFAAKPEPQIRALLDFCRLPFEADCLPRRGVRRGIATARYGAQLDPLRDALGIARESASRR